MKLRTFVFWPHLVVGLLAGPVILLMSATGVLLTYEKQLLRWSEWDARAAAPAAGAERLPTDRLVAAAMGAGAEAPRAVTVYADPDAPVVLSYGRRGQLLVNGYTGATLGEGSPRLRGFLRAITAWHRWLGREGEARGAARAITGACNLAFLFLIVSGAYLWIPRRWHRRALRAVTFPRLALRGRARDWSWHNALGFWAALPLFFVVLSAVVISYPWARGLLLRAAGAPRAASRGPEPEPAAEPLAAGATAKLSAAAAAQEPGWTAIRHAWPLVREGRAVFTVATGTGAQPKRRLRVTLDANSAAVLEVQRWEDLDSGRRARAFNRFLHTGEVYGLIGQTIAGLASLAATVLVYTGFALAYRRFFGRRRRVGARGPVAPSEPPAP